MNQNDKTNLATNSLRLAVNCSSLDAWIQGIQRGKEKVEVMCASSTMPRIGMPLSGTTGFCGCLSVQIGKVSKSQVSSFILAADCGGKKAKQNHKLTSRGHTIFYIYKLSAAEFLSL